MKYLKVKKEDYYILNRKNKSLFCLVKDELYTQKEFEKLKEKYYLSKEIIKDLFEKIEINKNKTFFCFGARFSNCTETIWLKKGV